MKPLFNPPKVKNPIAVPATSDEAARFNAMPIAKIRAAYLDAADVLTVVAYLQHEYRMDALTYVLMLLTKLSEVENGAIFDNVFTPEVRAQLKAYRASSIEQKALLGALHDPPTDRPFTHYPAGGQDAIATDDD
jgi:hypothetical protein